VYRRLHHPSINQTATTLACIDYASSVLPEFARRQDPENRHKVGHSYAWRAVRLGFENLLDHFFDPLRFRTACRRSP
jgi:hypothetical protein